MANPTPEMRSKVYERARGTIERQIEAMPKRPSEEAIQRQFAKLDAAIAEVEASYSVAVAEQAQSGYDDDLDHLFADDIPAAKDPAAVESETIAEADASGHEAPEAVDPTASEETANYPAETVHDPVEPVDELHDPTYDPVEPVGEPADEVDALEAFLAEQEKEPELEVFEEPEEVVIAEPRSEPREPVEEPIDETETERSLPTPERRNYRGLLLAAALVLLLAGGGYLAYANQDRIMALFESTGPSVTETIENGVPVRSVQSQSVTVEDTAGSEQAEVPADSPDPAVSESTPGTDGPEKFTQRLTSDGREVDEGPAGTPDRTGEGTSVAGLTEDTATESGTAGPDDAGTAGDTPAGTGTQSPLPVGQRAIFYQERTGAQAGTAESGATVWSVVQESPGGDAPVEPAVRAEASVPELGLTMEMTIRRNADETFPASHVIELFYRVPNTFEGRGIADVQRITFKETEQDPGNALIGVAAPLDTNIFMIALTDAETAIETNLALIRSQEWIDIPMQYVSGRRALITLEKGVAGQEVFEEVLAAWEANPLP